MKRKDAMPALREKLVERRDALRQALAGDLTALKELRSQLPGDEVDAVLDSVQNEISAELLQLANAELTRINVALESMRKGQYGDCEGCSTPIPMVRLNALLGTTLCINCQREAERGEGVASVEADWGRLDSSSNEEEPSVSVEDIE